MHMACFEADIAGFDGATICVAQVTLPKGHSPANPIPHSHSQHFPDLHAATQ